MVDLEQNRKTLIERQGLPLDEKITLSKERIEEWYVAFAGQVYVSYSGGKDSTVLLHLVRSLYPEVPAVFCNTGLEYPEIVRFVRRTENVEFIYPNKKFKDVITEDGYPMISKQTANGISDVQNWSHNNIMTVRLRLQGYDSNDEYKPQWMIPKKWKKLCDAPFKVSDRCCDHLKKNPFKRYHRKSKRYGMNGMNMEEGGIRVQSYLKTGCNSFDAKEPKSMPLAFWTLQDILEYIFINELSIASVYGNIIVEDGVWKTTKVDRTGCVFCMFGVHLEDEPNRFQQLKKSHPKLWDYCMNKLELKQCLDFIDVPYE